MVSRWNNGVNEIAMFFSLGGGAAALGGRGQFEGVVLSRLEALAE